MHGWETARHATSNQVEDDITEIGTEACLVAVALVASRTQVLSLKFRIRFLVCLAYVLHGGEDT